MKAKSLRRMSREDLLELLIKYARENRQLSTRLREAERQLERRQIVMDSTGSLAEAALELNRVFDAAQAAATFYVENVRRLTEEQAAQLPKPAPVELPQDGAEPGPAFDPENPESIVFLNDVRKREDHFKR